MIQIVSIANVRGLAIKIAMLLHLCILPLPAKFLEMLPFKLLLEIVVLFSCGVASRVTRGDGGRQNNGNLCSGQVLTGPQIPSDFALGDKGQFFDMVHANYKTGGVELNYAPVWFQIWYDLFSEIGHGNNTKAYPTVYAAFHMKIVNTSKFYVTAQLAQWVSAGDRKPAAVLQVNAAPGATVDNCFTFGNQIIGTTAWSVRGIISNVSKRLEPGPPPGIKGRFVHEEAEEQAVEMELPEVNHGDGGEE